MEIETNFKVNEQTPKIIQEAINKGLNIIGAEYMRLVKPLTPVDTENLRDSYEREVSNDAVTITNTANYAAYVEYGDLSGKKPRRSGEIPFMRPTLYDNEDKWVQILQKTMKADI